MQRPVVAQCFADPSAEARKLLRLLGISASGLDPGPRDPHACSVADWAARGGMLLTGHHDGPRAPRAPVLSRVSGACSALEQVTRDLHRPVRLDPSRLLFGRAAVSGHSRRGRTSVGGSCRLIGTVDGWAAVNLARPSDLEAVGALICSEPTGEPWSQIEDFARRTTTHDVVGRAQLLGIPASGLGHADRGEPKPFRVVVAGEPGRRRAPCLIVDLSAMWAGPLCAQILSRAGGCVVKVETPGRPDGARNGPPAFYDWLHHGHASVCLDFRRAADVTSLKDLLARADVVIEGSRPRALAALGIDPKKFLADRPGRTWVSITGYGRDSEWANRVAFGDDAAAAGGLVASDADGHPVFCGDAIADPLAGLYAGLAAAASITGGGGRLIDIAMADSAAYAGRPGRGPHVEHQVARVGSGWKVQHHETWTGAMPAPQIVSPGKARPLGADSSVLAEALARC